MIKSEQEASRCSEYQSTYVPSVVQYISFAISLSV